MKYIKIICAFCGKKNEKYIVHVNRAISIGAPVYCNKKCAGLARRDNKTSEQKKNEKAEYDKIYRQKNIKLIKNKKALAFKLDYAENPEKYRQQRRRRYPKHLEYLRTPEYRKWKQSYDETFRAKKDYGVFWECSLLLKELESWLLNNSPVGMHFQMGITNKTQKRKRLWQKTMKKQQKNLRQQV